MDCNGVMEVSPNQSFPFDTSAVLDLEGRKFRPGVAAYDINEEPQVYGRFHRGHY